VISNSGSAYGGAKQDQILDENNKGHQLLKKMGWGGAGLGAMEQGIEQPISGGEVSFNYFCALWHGFEWVFSVD
jgi:calcium homeostasis endoplasmic reticulum protein